MPKPYSRFGDGDSCTRCGKKHLKGMVWLELDQRTMLYVDPEKTKVPEDKSQGAFPFGKSCAMQALKGK